MLAAVLVVGPLAWITKSQATFGVSLEAIRDHVYNQPKVDNPYAGQVVEGITVPRWEVRSQLSMMWNLIPNPQTEADAQAGLGGGITWAFDPALCDLLLPRFSEDVMFADSMVDCNMIRASVARAFNSWSLNNRYIKFLDVTEECEKRGINYFSWDHSGPSFDPTPETPAWNTNGAFGHPPNKFHGGCPLAEIWVTVMGPRADTSGDIAVATAATYERVSSDFYFTNGEKASPVRSPDSMYETFAGVLSIGINGTVSGNELCWYLDSDFCSGFHEFKASTGSPTAALQIIMAICWCVAISAGIWLIMMKCQAGMACFGCVSRGKRQADLDGDGELSLKERWIALLEEAADWSPIGLTLLICLVIVPLLVLYNVILPCWNCADFEGAMLHEIGHFLGLGHPDNVPANMLSSVHLYNGFPNPSNVYNAILANGDVTNSSNCYDLWNHTFTGTPPNMAEEDLEKKEHFFRNSVMEAFTQHNPKPCLKPDDVEAIATLYPDCSGEGTTITTPVCHKVQHNIGWVRITVYVLCPLIITFLCVISCSSIVHSYQKDELEKARAKLLKAEKKLEKKEAMVELKAEKKAAKAAKKEEKKAAKRGQGPTSQFEGVDEISSTPRDIEPHEPDDEP